MIDLVAIIEKGLTDGHRPPDGLLHASSDLVGSLRHSQLRLVGAPELERDITSDIRLQTGTMWHSYIGSLLVSSGAPVLQEVNLTPWMPEGWSGTADWLFFDPEYEAFALKDLKTTKGESMKFKTSGGMSTEHHHQISLYWHALVSAGFPMLDYVEVLYLPMNTVSGEDVKPEIIRAKPLDFDYMADLANARWKICKEYADFHALGTSDDLTEGLAPIMPRVQKLVWDSKASHWNVNLVPHWTAQFCPFPDELCNCNTQPKSEKIGHWTWYDDPEHGQAGLQWEPRTPSGKIPRGGDGMAPEVEPDAREIKRRLVR